MIRREMSDVDWLITQDDHAHLSGELLAHWGNGRFERVESAGAAWASVVLAARMHDCGWPLHDERPTLNRQGRPLDVFETPWPIALRVWGASADRAEAADAYGGLLVSLHVLALAAELGRSDRTDRCDPAGVFAINKFHHREIERQEQLRRRLGMVASGPLKLGLAPQHASEAEDLLRLHVRAVQAADAISLGLCCAQPPAKTREVHRSSGSGAIALELARDAEGVLRVDPWPFDVSQLELAAAARRLPAQRWEERAFLAAFGAAPAETLAIRVAELLDR